MTTEYLYYHNLVFITACCGRLGHLKVIYKIEIHLFYIKMTKLAETCCNAY